MTHWYIQNLQEFCSKFFQDVPLIWSKEKNILEPLDYIWPLHITMMNLQQVRLYKYVIFDNINGRYLWSFWNFSQNLYKKAISVHFLIKRCHITSGNSEYVRFFEKLDFSIILYFDVSKFDFGHFLTIFDKIWKGPQKTYIIVYKTTNYLNFLWFATAIIECGVNIHVRARGTFFLPRDQQHEKPAKETNYEGLIFDQMTVSHKAIYLTIWPCFYERLLAKTSKGN